MSVKGDLKLEFDEQAIEVRVTIVPNENGSEVSTDSLLSILDEKRVREGIDTEAIDKALRSLSRKKGEPVSFVAATGVMPRPPEPETVEFEPCPVPQRLASVARSVLEKAAQPKGFRLREERIKKEKKVLRKPSLPFLAAREEVEVVVEKRLVREEVAINPAVTATGFVQKGALVAKILRGDREKKARAFSESWFRPGALSRLLFFSARA